MNTKRSNPAWRAAARRLARGLLLVDLAALALTAAAQARDPFEPPGVARAAPVAAAPAAADMPTVRHLVRIGGRPYVLDGARRYGVGDSFGPARIECIVDAGVVVRDQGALRLLPIHGGVLARPSAAPLPKRPLCPGNTGNTR